MKIAFIVILLIFSIAILFLWMGVVNLLNKNDRLTEENRKFIKDIEKYQRENASLEAKIKALEAEKDKEIKKGKKYLDNFYSYDGTEQE